MTTPETQPAESPAHPFQFSLRTLLLVVTGFVLLLSAGKLVGLLLDYLEGPISERGLAKIKVGMILDEVEAILGPGTKAEQPPEEQGRGPVIHGDHFYRWESCKSGQEIYLAFKNGKVYEKWYWEPSL